jgi:hypothetical protein
MKFVHLKMELCNLKLCTPYFRTLYYNIWNFILLGTKLYHHENCFKTYPTWIYFYRSSHNGRNGENGIKNRCLTRKLLYFKVYIPFANAKKAYLIQSTWSAPLPASPSTLSPRSPIRHIYVYCYMVDSPCAMRTCTVIW